MDDDGAGTLDQGMGNGLPAIDLGTGCTAISISTGSYHTCALLDDATVKCWGWNNYGQLGQGSTTNLGDNAGEMGNALLAINLGTGRTAQSIATGDYHTCALLDDSNLKCWGFNLYGGLGQGHAYYIGDGVDDDGAGTLDQGMGDLLPAVDLGNGRTALAIVAGVNHTCALLDDATVKCWGDDSYGQLGQGTFYVRGDSASEMGDNLPAIDLGTGYTAQGITTGNNHSCALLDDGGIKCWGYNLCGQLGQGSTQYLGDQSNEMGDNLPVIPLGLGP